MIKGFEKYKDYRFDYETFEKDLEGYPFTKDDIMYLNLQELEKYEQKVPMTPAEKRSLRKWVASGHSVHEQPGSRYVPDPYGQDFLDIYRMDKEIGQAIRGTTDAEKERYLKDYIGYTDDEPDRIPEEKALKCAYEKTPDKIRNLFRRKNRELFYIWMFLSAEGLQEEAEEYLVEKMDSPIPFEDDLWF